MPIELKICGINSKNIIQTIIQNGGCQYLGFVFYPPSPRNLSIEESKKLTSIVPNHIKKVAVLVKPERPLPCLMVLISFFLPVRILCG